MQNLIDGLEVTRETYASVTNPMRKKSPQSESSYNGSVLTEVRESIIDDNHHQKDQEGGKKGESIVCNLGNDSRKQRKSACRLKNTRSVRNDNRKT